MSPPGGIIRNLFGIIFQHWPRVLIEQAQTGPQNPLLEVRIIGLAQRPAQFIGNPKGSWWFNGFAVLPNQGDLGGAETLLLKVMGQPAYGARASGSNGHQQNGVHPFVFHQSGYLAGAVFVSLGFDPT